MYEIAGLLGAAFFAYASYQMAKTEMDDNNSIQLAQCAVICVLIAAVAS